MLLIKAEYGYSILKPKAAALWGDVKLDTEILLVAPYKKLAELAEQLKPEIGLPFDVAVGNLDENRQDIDAIIQQGIKVIISRGGTAQYLRERLDIPVVEIPVTSFDILHAISSMEKKGYTKFAFSTAANIIVSAEHFEQIRDLSLRFEPSQVKGIPTKVKELIAVGIEAIVGDVYSTREAIANGIHGQLLESGQESLLYAMREAERVLEANKKEKARIQEMEAILNVISEAVLAINRQGQVTLYNVSAERIFECPREKVIGQRIGECLPNSDLGILLQRREKEKNVLMEIDRKKIIGERIPVVIDNEVQGAVAVFEEVTHIQELELSIRQRAAAKGLVAKRTFSQVTTNSPEMMKIIKQARQYARSEGTILIHGETGTGKELFAQSIHNASKRASGPFISINCAALSESLLESELFGYAEGSFTGATKGGKEGLFELAHGGSIFLDEIGEISANFQAKLLRVLQEKEVRRVGGDKVIPVDVRIICATNRDLKEEVKNKRFREDLYYRLAVLELKLPPLRERKADIIPMAVSFIKQECIAESKNLYWHSDDIFCCLLKHKWYGNARELYNFINRLVICSEEGELQEAFIEEMLASELDEDKNSDQQITIRVHKNLKQMEAEFLTKMIDNYGGNKKLLCEDLKISPMTLWRKLKNKNDI